ncbi:hypothetical protein AVEN_95351-1 [Araneus ventricosus]|uniref:Uncharacterized protein n=1 Tax=Araneus ventricosus TaxID=182803 RepID=A0A4Y2EHG3_ARAVE|nr:hypothetical protein AVEN_95351-1 [Araneus ventricosus]
MHARPIKIEDNTDKEKDDKFESLLRELEKLLDRLEAGEKNAPRWNPNVTCRRCNEKGQARTGNACPVLLISPNLNYLEMKIKPPFAKRHRTFAA